MKPILEELLSYSHFFFALVIITQKTFTFMYAINILLFTVNTLNEVSTKSPRPKTNATALVLWIQTCLFYIVAAMAEFACLLIVSKIEEMSKRKGQNIIALTVAIKHLDKVMLVFYPIFFAFHTSSFWSTVANQ